MNKKIILGILILTSIFLLGCTGTGLDDPNWQIGGPVDQPIIEQPGTEDPSTDFGEGIQESGIYYVISGVGDDYTTKNVYSVSDCLAEQQKCNAVSGIYDCDIKKVAFVDYKNGTGVRQCFSTRALMGENLQFERKQSYTGYLTPNEIKRFSLTGSYKTAQNGCSSKAIFEIYDDNKELVARQEINATQ
jgi:hypothetical protein